MREIRIRNEESGQRLDKFLRRYLPGAGSGFLYKMLRKKNIVLDDKKATGKELLKEGDSIRIYFSDDTIRAFQSQASPADETHIPPLPDSQVVYEDDSLLIVNKPAGILTQKASKQDISLTDMVRSRLFCTGMRKEEDRFYYEPGPANRIDRNTSGIVLFPLTLSAARQISHILRERTIHKQYLALVAGEYRGPEKQTAWCSRDTGNRKTEIYFYPKEGTDRIETHCRPLVIRRGRTLLQVTLVTGRTHQIRSHLQACGYPVIGDPKYGQYLPDEHSASAGKTDPTPETGLKRQFLHAWRVEFPSCGEVPEGVSGKTFAAALPLDLTKELSACGMQIPEPDRNGKC